MHDDKSELIKHIRSLASSCNRILIAVAGPPASGKSTFAKELHNEFDNSVVVPMDGFHLDNSILKERGLLARKGSPETFDIEGYLSLLKRIKTSTKTVYAPSFDRQADLSRNAAIEVKPETKIIVAEGNYLLLKQSPWDQFTYLFDVSVYLHIPMNILEQRLLQRWQALGLPRDEAFKKVSTNDLPNAELVTNNSTNANYHLTN